MSAPTTTAPRTSGGPGAPSTWERVRTWSPPSQYLPVIATAVVFVSLFTIGGVRYEGFATPDVVLDLLVDNAFLIVLAVGMTFVILTGGIDLSVGSVVALSTMVAARTLEAGWSPGLAVLVVLLTGTVLGLLMGLVIHYFDIQPFIATLAGMFLARGLCYLISVESIPIRDETFYSIAAASIPLPGGLSTTPTAVVALVVVAIAAWVLHRTRFGRTVYALGGSESSALLMGLRVARTKVAVYAISGFCASLAGLLFSLYMLSGYSLHAVGMELDAIAAVVIGGTLLTGGRGLVLGSLLGVLVLGAIQTFISFDGTLSSWWTKITIGALLLLFVVVQRLITRRQP
ncbi:monosaccharide ABC transporter membrane protein, CUT2 family [Nocardioides scoriae]|uniref:Monosaccharide ABC transporter membrane protein, CUT2 family n=1 Tax=Nocardioides scoriae TaxID=642780 RepID=A0A1H1W9M5_9ACTN|nr:galactofuranose ABC transporter, permease protein YjfF [Nocardioides scoriae]SDS93350.1 monosaccharide ABC transporter membrane protein, CUT2 family [Nocardioides scoriae]